MRIGMFADMYLPHISGVTNHVQLHKAELERQGHDVLLFTYGNTEHADEEPCVFRSTGLAYGNTGWNIPLGVSTAARQAMDTIDIAHAHHPFSSCLSALQQGRKRSIPVVFTSHTRYDLYSDTYAGWIPRAVRYGSIERYLAWLGSRVSTTISPSGEISSWLIDAGIPAEKLVVLNNVIETSKFREPAADDARRELGIPDDSFALCYVGRVAHEKNVALLMDAFVIAAAAEPRLSLVVIGDGPARQQCEKVAEDAGVSDSVRFLGMVPYEKVPSLLASSDAFVTASVSETYPLVVLEACAAGLPVIGVRSPGVGEIVSDGESGILTAEEAHELSAAMVAMARDSSLVGRLRDGALRTAQAHDVVGGTTALVNLYERLLASAPRE